MSNAHNPFSTLQQFDLGNGKQGALYSLPQLEKTGIGPVSKLPVSIRLVLESVLRNCDGKRVSEAAVRALANWKPNEARTEEIVAGIEAQFRSAQREALGNIEREARKAGIAVREEIQKDIDAGRLHARELIVELNRAYTRSAVRRWVAIGVVAASGLVVLGVGLGVLLARVLK